MKTLFTLLAALLLVSCAKFSIDNTDPEIEVLLSDGQGSLAGMNAGSTATLDLFVSDDENLYEVLVKLENIKWKRRQQSSGVAFV